MKQFIRILALAMVTLLCAVPLCAVQLIGTIEIPQGNRFNGTLTLTPLKGGQDTCSNRVLLPISQTFDIVNGSLPPSTSIVSSDCIQPTHVPYIAEFRNLYGKLIMQANYMITGSVPYDIGVATPTSVTTLNVSYISPARTDVPQTWPFAQYTKVSNGIRNAALFTGADFGAQINAAIADFGVTNTCGEVILPQGDYTFSTPISMGVRNGCTFRGAGSGGNTLLAETGVGTTLNYIGTGTAFSNSGANYHTTMYGFRLIKASGTSTIGLQLTNTFYAHVHDVSVYGFPRNFVVYGGPFGTNVMRVDHVDSLGATQTALEITGPGTVSQGGYNITITGGQFGCASTTSTTGILINAQSADNNVISPLINGCGIGIDLTDTSSNTFIGPSIQGGVGTTPIRLSATTASNLFKHPYIFTGIGIVDNCGYGCYNQFSEMQNAGAAGKPNILTGDLYVSPYNGGTHPNMVTEDYDETGNPRIAMYQWTGAGTGYYPLYIRNNLGGIEIQRADTGAIPTALHTSLPNKATIFATNAIGKITNLSGTVVVGQGATGIVAFADATAQSANLGSTGLYSAPATGAGMYRASCVVTVTRAATTSSTLPNCRIFWTDAETSVGGVLNVASGLPTANTIGTQVVGATPINIKASTSAVFDTSGYASVGATTMQYSVHIKLEFIGN